MANSLLVFSKTRTFFGMCRLCCPEFVRNHKRNLSPTLEICRPPQIQDSNLASVVLLAHATPPPRTYFTLPLNQVACRTGKKKVAKNVDSYRITLLLGLDEHSHIGVGGRQRSREGGQRGVSSCKYYADLSVTLPPQ